MAHSLSSYVVHPTLMPLLTNGDLAVLAPVSQAFRDIVRERQSAPFLVPLLRALGLLGDIDQNEGNVSLLKFMSVHEKRGILGSISGNLAQRGALLLGSLAKVVNLRNQLLVEPVDVRNATPMTLSHELYPASDPATLENDRGNMMMEAIVCGDENMVRELVAFGFVDNFSLCVIEAVKRDNRVILNLLLASGLPFSAYDRGMALNTAALWNHTEIAQQLLRLGPIEPYWKQSALAYAKKHGNQELVDLLEDLSKRIIIL